jgi:hypothetical protein
MWNKRLNLALPKQVVSKERLGIGGFGLFSEYHSLKIREEF